MTDEAVDDGREHNDGDELTYDVGPEERPSEAIVLAVAAYTDEDVLDLDPLYGTVDPEHLDGAVDPRGEDTPGCASVVLEYAGCRLTVTGEEVRVRDADDAR